MSQENLLLSFEITNILPSMVKNELAKMTPQKQEDFGEEFLRQRKSLSSAFLFYLFLGFHYAYLRKWGLQFVYWFTCGGFFIWMIIDLFRLSRLVDNYNKDISVDIFRNLKSLSQNQIAYNQITTISTDKISYLKELKQLLDNGTLTQVEFDQQKQKLLEV